MCVCFMYDCMHISYATNIQKVEKSKKQSMTGTMIRRIWLQNKWQVATNGEARKYTVHALWWFTSLKGEFLAISTGARRLKLDAGWIIQCLHKATLIRSLELGPLSTYLYIIKQALHTLPSGSGEGDGACKSDGICWLSIASTS